MTIQEMEFPQLIQKFAVDRDYQMLLMKWGFDYADPDAMVKPLAHCDSHEQNATIKVLAWITHYCDNQELTQLVEQAAQELDAARREAMYQQITNEVLHYGPYALLYTPEKVFAVRTEVRDFIEMPSIMFGGFPLLK